MHSEGVDYAGGRIGETGPASPGDEVTVTRKSCSAGAPGGKARGAGRQLDRGHWSSGKFGRGGQRLFSVIALVWRWVDDNVGRGGRIRRRIEGGAHRPESCWCLCDIGNGTTVSPGDVTMLSLGAALMVGVEGAADNASIIGSAELLIRTSKDYLLTVRVDLFIVVATLVVKIGNAAMDVLGEAVKAALADVRVFGASVKGVGIPGDAVICCASPLRLAAGALVVGLPDAAMVALGGAGIRSTEIVTESDDLIVIVVDALTNGVADVLTIVGTDVLMVATRDALRNTLGEATMVIAEAALAVKNGTAAIVPGKVMLRVTLEDDGAFCVRTGVSVTVSNVLIVVALIALMNGAADVLVIDGKDASMLATGAALPAGLG